MLDFRTYATYLIRGPRNQIVGRVIVSPMRVMVMVPLKSQFMKCLLLL